MVRTKVFTWVVALLLALPGLAAAQTSTPGSMVDIEVYNADGNGSNHFVVQQGVPFWAYVYVRPGTGTTSCGVACGTVPGGNASLATAAIDLAFDPAMLSYGGAENNGANAGQDGLIQTQNLGAGRLGWALAGDFVTNGNPAGGLKTPCASMRHNSSGWLFRVSFTPLAVGSTAITLRAQPDFQLSFGDYCGSGPFVPGSGVDEVLSASVTVFDSMIFSDGFESGNTSAWGKVVN